MDQCARNNVALHFRRSLVDAEDADIAHESLQRQVALKVLRRDTAPDEQAAPVETWNPARSSAIASASPATPSNSTFVVLGVRGAEPALTRVPGTF